MCSEGQLGFHSSDLEEYLTEHTPIVRKEPEKRRQAKQRHRKRISICKRGSGSIIDQNLVIE